MLERQLSGVYLAAGTIEVEGYRSRGKGNPSWKIAFGGYSSWEAIEARIYTSRGLETLVAE